MTPARTYQKEADVKAEVKKLLAARRWMLWMPPANGYGRGGIADINALRDGVFLAIETKFGYGKPSPMQVKFLQEVHNHGGFGFVVNEQTIDWLRTWLDAFDRAAGATSKRQEVAPEDGAAMIDAIDHMTRAIR